MEMRKGWRGNLIISGGIIGALLGVIAAYILIKSAEQEEKAPHLTPKKGVQIGLGVVSLLKSFANLHKSE